MKFLKKFVYFGKIFTRHWSLHNFFFFKKKIWQTFFFSSLSFSPKLFCTALEGLMLSIDVSDKFLRNWNAIYVQNVCVEEGMADFGPFYEPNNVLWGECCCLWVQNKNFPGVWRESTSPQKTLNDLVFAKK